MDKALIVDDSRAIRRILGVTVKNLGFEVCEAGNGKQALEALEREGEVQLMLVDWNMPEMNGLEFVTEVRKQNQYDKAKVMMVTTETAVDQMVRALDAGADEYIMKPFTEDSIRDKLKLMGVLA